MATIIVAHEKHGTFTYSTALGLLGQRFQDGYWYDDAAQEKARLILAERSERKAWHFLEGRSSHEYEYVERQEIRG